MDLDNFKDKMRKEEPSLYAQIVTRFHEFHFNYPGRREVNIH